MGRSNARLERKRGGLKNKGYIPLTEAELRGLDLSEFQIPLYEEMKYLRLEDFEE